MYGVEPYVETKGEEYMGEPMKKHFTKLLGAGKQADDQCGPHCGPHEGRSSQLPDPADRASREEEFALELRNRDRERKLIKKIDKTLDKIKAMNTAGADRAVSKSACAVWKPVLPQTCASTARKSPRKGKNGRQRLIFLPPERGA